MLQKILLYIFILAFVVGKSQVFVVEPNNNATCYSLVESAIYLEDATHSIEIGELINNLPKYQSRFQPLISKGKNPNLDFTSSSYWVKFSVNNKTPKAYQLYLEVARSLTNKADLYHTVSGKLIKVSKNGDEIPFYNREIKHRKLIFPLHFSDYEQIDFYLHLKSDGEALSIPLNLWKRDSFSERDYVEQFIIGIYYGILFFVFVIYFFFFIVLKDRTYLYYIGFIFSLFFLQFSLDGFAFQYLWPSNTWMASHALVLTSSLSFLFIMLYTQSFLKISTRSVSLKKTYKILIILSLIGFISTFTYGKMYAFSYPYINILSLCGLLFVFYAIIRIHLKKYHVCPYFISAFIFSIIGISLFILGQLSVIPQSMFTEHGLKLGSGFEVLFLSISMANKYRELQKEKDEAKNEILKKLEEMNHLKDEINIELEKKVNDRTIELIKQKEILAEKNDEILSSIRYAKRIQNAILPSYKQVNELFSDSFIFYKPKDIVAGDFYWMEKIQSTPYSEGGKGSIILFAAADCTGHGVPGAMVSVVCNNALNRSVREFGIYEPGKILDKTREIVVEEFAKSNEDVKDGMDISLCKLEMLHSGNCKLEWAGANNPLWIIRSEPFHNELSNLDFQLSEIKPNKQPIGQVDAPQAFTTHTIELKKGETFYIFTDGFQDQFGGEKGKKFKASKLKSLLLSIQNKTMKNQMETINNVFNNWKMDIEQVDDVCIIGVRI